MRLLNALIAVHALREFFPGGSHLLRDDSQWWDRAQWQPYGKYFAQVHAVSRDVQSVLVIAPVSAPCTNLAYLPSTPVV